MLVRAYTPTTGQSRIHNACLGKHKFIVCVTPRQFGKTTAALTQALKWVLEHNNSICWYIFPTYSQCREAVYDRLTPALNNAKQLLKNINKSELCIEFVNGSKLYFKSEGSGNNLRGATIDYAVLDEYAFFNDQTFFDSVIQPTLFRKGKKVLFVSTPKGKNDFYKKYIRGFDNELWISIKSTYEENELITQAQLDFVEQERLRLPDNIFRSEWQGEFVDDGEVFSGFRECIVDSNEPYAKSKIINHYVGIDYGKVDYTVMTVINQDYEVVDIVRFKGIDWEKTNEQLEQAYNKYKVRGGFVECNGVGSIADYLVKRCKGLIKFTTTMNSKEDLVSGLIYAFNTKRIKIPNYEPLIRELESFSYTYNPNSGNIKYAAPSGLNDDCVMSLAIANKCYANMNLRSKISLGK